LTWVQKLQPNVVLVENVKEFSDWGPVENGTPTRNGDVFDAWVNALQALGYSVDWQVLNAADYGDPTSRRRLFIMACREGRPEFPEPTHSDTDDDLPDRPTAAEIINWDNLGGSIWTRDLHDGRKKPLKNSTMERIAEGLRRHCSSVFEPFADFLEQIGREEVYWLRNNAIPKEYVATAAAQFDQPFLAEVPKHSVTGTPTILGQHSNAIARDVHDRPSPTVTTGGKIHLCVPETYLTNWGRARPTPSMPPIDTITADGGHYGLTTAQSILLRQQDGGTPVNPTEQGVPTIPRRGAHSLATTAIRPLIKPRNGAYRGLHSNPLYPPEERPLHTVTAKNHDGHLTTPSLIRYSHGGATLDLDEPIPTIATERGGVFALSSPYLCPMYNGREAQAPRTRDVDRPLMTIPASKSPAGVATPFLVDYHGNSSTASLTGPLGTLETRDRYALVIPECWPYGFDVRYRMLQPRELAAAQGFPPDFEFVGTKTARTEQIGNAVPVNLGKALFRSLLESDQPSLTDYLDSYEPEIKPDDPDVGEQLAQTH
jgi:DNA (cytosine-5)-methyltransferase 1